MGLSDDPTTLAGSDGLFHQSAGSSLQSPLQEIRASFCRRSLRHALGSDADLLTPIHQFRLRHA
jgi:hypothetical protein